MKLLTQRGNLYLIQRYLGKGVVGNEKFFFNVGLLTLSLLLLDRRFTLTFSSCWTFLEMRSASAQCLAILWSSAVVEEVLNRPKARLLSPAPKTEW